MSPKESDPHPPLPPQPPQFEELLRRSAPRFGLSAQLPFEVLASFLAELSRWQRSINLTGRLTAADLADHALESAMGEQLIIHGARLIDIGSGGGFPGIPLAILRGDLEVRLLEPRTKRAAFLRHAIRALSLANAEVIERRLEDVDLDDVGGQTFDAATVRAVKLSNGRLPPHLFSRGGQFVAWTTCAPAPPPNLAQWLGASWTLERTLPIPHAVSRCIVSFRSR